MTNEKLGVLLIDVPEPKFAVYHFVYLSELGFMIKPSSDSKIILDIAYKCTAEEAKKYPQFRWVALEDLE
ncbi:hypothetical protein PWF76_10465 [Streptococcus suis]|uniref:hypothetical protein n=1 Tax=Streptococcus suis TaxID=1307 RepID=UPI00237CDFF3|nr:hypothetical protein [Streptococcus suis]MDE1693095.1 hypothetical protein [Streptococcus suis]